MKSAKYYISRAKEIVKENSRLMTRTAGINLLDKNDSDLLLRPSRIFKSNQEVLILNGVAHFVDERKVLFEKKQVTPATSTIWKVKNINHSLTLMRCGCVKSGRSVLTTDFDNYAAARELFIFGRRARKKTRLLIAPWGHYWAKYYDYVIFVAAKLARIRRVLSEEEFAEAVVAYPLLGTAFEREMLHLLGFSDNRICDSRKVDVQFDYCVLGSNDSWFYPNVDDIMELRQRLIQSNLSAGHAGGKRIYISRKGRRRVLNEDAVIKLLQEYDFEIIEDRLRTISQQIDIFSSAEVIIGPHGSGFTNILTCRPGTHLIELFPDNYIVDYFRYLAAVLGLKYSAYCHGFPGSHHCSNDRDDMEVSIDSLREGLEKCLGQRV